MFNKGNPATLHIAIARTAPPSARPAGRSTGTIRRYVNATIVWHDAGEVKDVKAEGISIRDDNYGVRDDTLTIKEKYLATKPVGELVLTVEFDEGSPAALTIAVIDTTPPAISPALISYDLDAPADILTNITWNSANSVTGVTHGSNKLLSGTDYTVSGGALTIHDSYLSALGLAEGDELAFCGHFRHGRYRHPDGGCGGSLHALRQRRSERSDGGRQNGQRLCSGRYRL